MGEVEAFWEWFAAAAAEIARDLSAEDKIRAFDAQVPKLGDGIVWEIGPGLDAPNMLVISPDGDPDLLERTKQIVALAPPVPGWEFHSSRPPKQWDLQITIGGLHVDARAWRYVLHRYPDGVCDVVLEQPNLEIAEMRDTAAELVVDAILGEERRMLEVATIEAVARLPAEHASTAIEHLSKHLASLRGGS